MKILPLLLLALPVGSFAASPAPTRLTTDLIEHTNRVFLNGYPSQVSLSDLNHIISPHQFAEIRNPAPVFGWVVNDDKPGTLQTAYRILVASSVQKLAQNKGDIWDSGKINSDNSVAVTFAGNPLKTATTYYWKVKTWNNHGDESAFSPPKSFRTAATLDGKTANYPLQITDEFPSKINRIEPNITFADFGKASFGRLKITLSSDTENARVTVRLGECLKNNRIDKNPGGSRRHNAYTIELLRGTHTYTVGMPKKRAPLTMPSHTGEVMPFRYCEIENYTKPLEKTNFTRQSVSYPFDDTAASFSSSDTTLNAVWELCKYTMKATSFIGVFIDGDRERTPYEADAYINQLSYYCVDREYTIARRSHEFLIKRATWPTEWILHSVLLAGADYLYTGNLNSARLFYNDLKAKTLLALKEENGLISTRTAKMTPEFLKSIHFKGKLRDIVDWPQSGAWGAKGETDGFAFTKYNTVVNAFHYEALRQMEILANALGKSEDKITYEKEAKRVKQQINTLLLDKERGIYTDGLDTKHASLHANMLPRAFGVVPQEHFDTVSSFIRSRKMACSVYGAQYLLDAVYENGDADYGLSLLTSKDDRSWFNMLRVGSTITLEAWDNKYKPNQDWNHAWGAVPANAVIRKLMGVEPVAPGFATVRIRPQTASLAWAKARIPTLRGTIDVAVENKPEHYTVNFEIPPNMKAEIWLPIALSKRKISLNGKKLKPSPATDKKFAHIANVLPGKYTLKAIPLTSPE
ncbi:MAG: family 78 glycoside hydrolase catalytic domain [Puniceicoccales bacterium]|nr:family 78 glycoside hydrolase catalytic domain [Puniceicoccales bacterium]